MKKAIAIVFWVFSVSLALMALALSSASVFSGALLLGCAVLINPLFFEKVQLKKGLTALLTIGLFIASVAVFPAGESVVDSSADQRQVPRAIPAANYDLNDATIDRASTLVLIDDTQASGAASKPTPTRAVSFTPMIKPTPTLSPSPTPTQSSTPTLKPTPTPKPTPTSAPLTRAVGILILDYSAYVRRNSFAFIEIQGAANTDYTCDVEYKSGMSTADGLGKKRSDANGKVIWRWKVGPRTSLDYTPTIYIEGGGDSISVDFDVTQ